MVGTIFETSVERVFAEVIAVLVGGGGGGGATKTVIGRGGYGIIPALQSIEIEGIAIGF